MRRQPLEIGMAMLHQHGAYLLQRRGSDPKIGAAGLIGCFGGKREEKETYAVATARELGEETNIVVKPGQLTAIGRVNVPSDIEGKPVKIHVQAYSYDVPAAFTVVATEGALEAMTLSEMRLALQTLTPATRACVEQLMGAASE